MYTKTLKIGKVSALFQLVKPTCHTKIDRLSEVLRLVYSVTLLATSSLPGQLRDLKNGLLTALHPESWNSWSWLLKYPILKFMRFTCVKSTKLTTLYMTALWWRRGVLNSGRFLEFRLDFWEHLTTISAWNVKAKYEMKYKMFSSNYTSMFALIENLVIIDATVLLMFFFIASFHKNRWQLWITWCR